VNCGVSSFEVFGQNAAIELGQKNLLTLYFTAKSNKFFNHHIFTSHARSGFCSPTADNTHTK
jgi:hypothetical protein